MGGGRGSLKLAFAVISKVWFLIMSVLIISAFLAGLKSTFGTWVVFFLTNTKGRTFWPIGREWHPPPPHKEVLQTRGVI